MTDLTLNNAPPQCGSPPILFRTLSSDSSGQDQGGNSTTSQTPVVFSWPATSITDTTADLSGYYYEFPDGDLLVLSYNINPCSIFTANSSTAIMNSTFTSQSQDNFPIISVSGLIPSTLYCYQVCTRYLRERMVGFIVGFKCGLSLFLVLFRCPFLSIPLDVCYRSDCRRSS